MFNRHIINTIIIIIIIIILCFIIQSCAIKNGHSGFLV